MKCKFEHDGDCCNSGAAQYMCKCKKPCDTIMPITNADRIRAMSDEELEAFLIDVDLDKAGSPFINEWGKWLQQPVKETDHAG